MTEDGIPKDEQPFWRVPQKPIWKKWERDTKARLWQAVALACDLDPANYQVDQNTPQLSTLFLQPPPQFFDVLNRAKINMGPNDFLKPLSDAANGQEECEVSLSQFATWLRMIGHRPPEEFPWQPEQVIFANLTWPWGRHETKLLRKLAAAAYRFWKDYVPGEPSTAPTNKQVVTWLIEQGVPPRTAEAMATILRADGLPSGPRKNAPRPL